MMEEAFAQAEQEGERTRPVIEQRLASISHPEVVATSERVGRAERCANHWTLSMSVAAAALSLS
jgi:hypothetical protein